MSLVEEQVANMTKEKQPHNNSTSTVPENNNITQIEQSWEEDSRWSGISRPYSARDVIKLRGTLPIIFSFAHAGAERLWDLLHSKEYIISFPKYLAYIFNYKKDI